ncbi:MAG: aldo/keto reductase [Verrucomicrobia bacterium]|nr:aldo/keto reductase [Verrucomicrobiota bacterium]MCF7709525.1 aldo/keto reductase [Verrucomicrobiota bacterium]
MRTVRIGKSRLESSRLAYGCWRLAGTWDPSEVKPENVENGIRSVLAAIDSGYTFFDLADIYCDGQSELIFGQALQQAPGMRDKIIVATKCGIRFAGYPNSGDPYRYDLSADYIIRSCEESLKRIGIDTIDLFQLHRPDILMDPEEIAEAFSKLKQDGKVREFGVSNFTPSQVNLLKKACGTPLIVNQVEISLAKLDAFHDNTLNQCLAEKITPLAWSPLAGGVLANVDLIRPDDPRSETLERLHDTLRILANEYDATPIMIALAWLIKHPSGIIPIIGTTKPSRIHECTLADQIELSREHWYLILTAAIGERLP